jgi:hypothetical protein
MATRTQTFLVDDLDGSDASETVMFSLDGKSYVLDLSDSNAEKLRSAFKTYTDAARKGDVASAARRSVASSSSSASKRSDLAEIRDWANKNGFSVSTRGRVPQNVLDAFDAR